MDFISTISFLTFSSAFKTQLSDTGWKPLYLHIPQTSNVNAKEISGFFLSPSAVL